MACNVSRHVEPGYIEPHVLFESRARALKMYRAMRPAGFKGPHRACHLDALELCLIEDGYERGRIDGHEKKHTAGEYVIIPAGHEHSSWTERTSVVETVIHLDQRALVEQAAAMRVALPNGGTFPAGAELRHLLALAQAEASRGDGVALDSLLVYVRAWILGRAVPAVAESASLERKLERLEAALREDPSTKRSLAAMAREVGVSEFHFLRVFKKRFGRPPHAHLSTLRLARAAALLGEQQMNVTAIAHACGFASGAELSKAFKRRFGVAPSQWQEMPSADRKNASDAIFARG